MTSADHHHEHQASKVRSGANDRRAQDTQLDMSCCIHMCSQASTSYVTSTNASLRSAMRSLEMKLKKMKRMILRAEKDMWWTSVTLMTMAKASIHRCLRGVFSRWWWSYWLGPTKCLFAHQAGECRRMAVSQEAETCWQHVHLADQPCSRWRRWMGKADLRPG